MPTLIRAFLGGLVVTALGWVGLTAYELSKHSDAPKKEEDTEDKDQE